MLVARVGRDQFRQPVEVLVRGLESLEDEPNSRLAAEQARPVVRVGPVRYVVLAQVGHVVATEAGEPAPLELVERADDARSARVDAAEAHRLGLVLRVRRPAVVEDGLGLGHDLADRSLDRRRAPRLVDQLLVALGVEQGQR